MKKNIYPPDAPEFIRAIESAKNASDVSEVSLHVQSATVGTNQCFVCPFRKNTQNRSGM